MNKKRAKWTLIGCLAGLMIFGFVSTAMVSASDDKPKNKATLWSGYDEKHPWFDGKDWDWFRDMMDQPSLKPQEEGAIQNFPLDSVPRQGIEVETPESQRESQPKNPSKKTAASLAHGKFLFQTYCGACHGPHGDADTPVAE
ncbi:MAG: hypothetical protein OEW12_04080, partial [Deltaproteobacteria bacterium]|nr:hypothetical protein [Deltaproteobacteria bacterium]